MDRKIVAIIIVICALGYSYALFNIFGAYDGIAQTYFNGPTPALELTPRSPIATIVIAHGFAADKEMMKPMGLALAQNGYRVVLFDQPGHGGSSYHLGEANITDMMAWVSMEYGGPNYSVAGHSLGTLSAIEQGNTGTPISCMAISPIDGNVSRAVPRNLLIIAAGNDPEGIRQVAANALANATSPLMSADANGIYGNFSNGTAREILNLEGDNHITVIYDSRTYDAMIGWLDQAYGVQRKAISPYAGPHLWFFACTFFAIAAYFPVSYWVLRRFILDKYHFLAGSHGTLKPVSIIAVSAVLAAVLSYFTGTSFVLMPVASNASGFLLYMGLIGLVIYAFIWSDDLRKQKYSYASIIIPASLALLFLLYFVASLGVPAYLSTYNLLPGVNRMYYLVLIGALVLPYNLLNELLFRGIPGIRSLAVGAGMRAFAIAALLGGLIMAENSGFMLIILPVLLPLFIFLEPVSYMAYRWSGNVLVGAILNSFIIGWLLASAFPIGTF